MKKETKEDIDNYMVTRFERLGFGRKWISANRMLAQLGFRTKTPYHKDTIKRVDDYIQYLDGVFDLVLIDEYFDESLVLLKDLLCWNVDDIVYAKLNMENTGEESLSPRALKILEVYGKHDYSLYMYFKTKFLKTVKEFGAERMSKEVKELQERYDYWRIVCIREIGLNNRTSADGRYIHPLDYIMVNKIRSDARKILLCTKLFMQEKEYTKFLRNKIDIMSPYIASGYEVY